MAASEKKDGSGSGLSVAIVAIVLVAFAFHEAAGRPCQTRGRTRRHPGTHRLGHAAGDDGRDGGAEGRTARHDVLLDRDLHGGGRIVWRPARFRVAGHRHRRSGDGGARPRAPTAGDRSHAQGAPGPDHPRVRVGHLVRPRASQGARDGDLPVRGAVRGRSPAATLGSSLQLSPWPRRADTGCAALLVEARQREGPAGELGPLRASRARGGHLAGRLSAAARLAWLDIKVIEMWTDIVSPIIYYPFIVLCLMILSRSPLFDNLGTPYQLMVVFGVSRLYAAACAFKLRGVAERARGMALERFTHLLVRARGQAGAPAIASQIEIMTREIESLRRGAFAPLTEQPVVRALLLPISSAGGLTLFRYLGWGG